MLHLTEVVIVGDHIGDDTLLVGMLDKHILCIQQLGQAELIFGYVKCVIQVLDCIVLGQFVKVYEVGTVLVNDGIESQSIAPRGGEIAHIHVVIAGSFHLAPQQ